MRNASLFLSVITVVVFLLISPMTSFAAPPFQDERKDTPLYADEIVIPLYPELAQIIAAQGSVECEASVVDGRIYLVEMVEGHPAFNSVVMDAVKQWRYRSGIWQRVRLKFVFHIVEDKKETIYPARIKLPNEIHLYAHRRPAQVYFSNEH